ncbi:hypothetical protein CBR_g23946 [Chara braunii]|uniref:ABC transporter domain-containing protein n=1 Tax=Chara braunii TaxID=69332 RepID=A0A388L5B9_CHABU|nr:hypothetical protein CBR_g23946 [Chara braunii]|eukprot:GBG77501.1 hypothetical protein CBR_g23946 [Chara braunii]
MAMAAPRTVFPLPRMEGVGFSSSRFTSPLVERGKSDVAAAGGGGVRLSTWQWEVERFSRQNFQDYAKQNMLEVTCHRRVRPDAAAAAAAGDDRADEPRQRLRPRASATQGKMAESLFRLNGNLEPFRAEKGKVLIECRDVYKAFGDKHVLKGASFKVRHGEAVGIIGPSGTGKSTILRIMAGLLAPDKGEVYICGKKRTGLISDEDNPELRIGMVFQSAALFDSLTVRENVGFMLYEHSDLPDWRIRELVTESLAAVGLKGVEERVPAELSGGMKKRVALARAIISDGSQREDEVVMYDEPTAGLDPIASTVVEDLIRSLHIKGRDASGKLGTIASYVVVTHQHSTIRRAVDRLIFLHDGRVVWEGLTREFDTTSEAIVRQFAEGTLNGPIKY